MDFFQCMDGHELDLLGVILVEGAFPGSSYYAAELAGELDAANQAAERAGIPVRFRRK